MTLQFRIDLMRVANPLVWRRLLVPGSFTFLRLHRVIQEAFGWEHAHLFQFSPKGWGSTPIIGMHHDEDPDTEDSSKIKLSDIFRKKGQVYIYIYDFGDDWLHRIQLERITDEPAEKASLLEGEGRCPPEDCGGFPGYAGLKEALADPTHPEHEAFKEWVSLRPRQKWDPAAFNLKKAQAAVQRV